MTYGQTVVAKFTRNGITAWQAVSNVLGCSVERAKLDYGPIKPADEDAEPERPAVKRR